eukprot:scaffold16408_cov59-Isochrysis_galbana.AAC.1
MPEIRWGEKAQIPGDHAPPHHRLAAREAGQGRDEPAQDGELILGGTAGAGGARTFAAPAAAAPASAPAAAAAAAACATAAAPSAGTARAEDEAASRALTATHPRGVQSGAAACCLQHGSGEVHGCGQHPAPPT